VSRARQKVVGVLGGMGPLATADFYTKLVRLTPARADQDHLRVLIDSNPKIPDRTAALRGDGPDPTEALVATARGLERAGADLIAIPCNSAHAYLHQIRRSVGIPVLDIMEEVAAAAAALVPRPRAAGVLATSGTLEARLYHRALASRGIDVVEPAAVEQERVTAAIRSVKAATVREGVREVAAALIGRGAEVVVLGCTELPLVADREAIALPVLDATEVLAAAAVRAALPSGAEEFPGSPERSTTLRSPGMAEVPGTPRAGSSKPAGRP